MATATIGPAILAFGGLVRTFAMLKAALLVANPALLAAGVAIGLIGSAMMVNSSAMQGATGELIRHNAEANALISVIKDENTSQEVRNALIEKFNAKFGSYIGNIDKEKTSIEDLAKFQKLFNDELARKIKIAGVEKVLTREMEKAAQIQADLIDLETRRVDAQTKLQKIQAQNDPARTADLELNLMRTIEDVTESIARKTNQSKELVKAVGALEGQMESLNPSMETTATTTTKAVTAAELTKEQVKALKEEYERFNQVLSNQEKLRGQMMRAMAAEEDQQLKRDIEFLPAMEPIDMDDLVDPVVFTELPAGFAKLKAAAMDLSANISAAITGAAGDFAVGIGEMIGSAMAGGEGFKNFGTFALQTLAALLRQLGEMAIAAGLAVDSIKVALKSMTGAGAIAAGIALIALSSGIQTSMAKKANSMGGGGIPALAKGGIATGPTLALIGEGRGPEAVIPLDKLEGMMSGGMGSGNVVVTGRIQGSDILIANERASRERSRYRGF